MVRLSFAFDAIFFYSMRKEFNSKGVFWSLVIEDDGEFISFYKNDESLYFYWFTHKDFKDNPHHWNDQLK